LENYESIMKTLKPLLLVALLLASCSRSPQNDTLRIFNWSDYIGAKTIESFQTKTGAKVSYDNYSSNEDLIAKLDSGGAQYDLIFPSAYAVEILHAKGMLHSIDHAALPNLTNLMADFAHPSFDKELQFCVPYTWSTTGIGYDSTVISDDEAKSLEILFDPRFKGKILMLDDMRACLGMALKTKGYSVNSTNATEIAEAKEKLLSQKGLVHVYASSNIPQLLGSGEVKLAYAWSGDIIRAAQANTNIHYMIPKEGTLIYVDYMCIPKNAPNDVLALKFINHVLDPVIAADIADTIKYALPNTRTKDLVAPDTKALWNQLQTAKDMSKLEQVQNVGSALDLYDKAWQAVKAGN
jgi:spermidine/putrescine-binding protein